MTGDAGEVTRILSEVARGDRSSEAQLIALLYNELHRLAASYLRREKQNHTLQPTALINEAYLRLLKPGNRDWKSRAHFIGVAARVMRSILVDHARASGAKKRGAHAVRLSLEDCDAAVQQRPYELLALDEALLGLEKMNPRLSQVVELRYFGGLTTEEIAHHVGTSTRTVQNDWEFARAWLHAQIESDAGPA